MKKLLLILSIIPILALSGCAVAGENWIIGFGEHEKEYYEDGKLKKAKITSKTPIEDFISVSGIKTQ